MKRLVSCSLIVFLTSSGLVRAEDAVKFAYKFKKGDQAVYRSTTEMSQQQKVAGMDIKTEFKSTDVAQRTCQSVDEQGNFKFRIENKSLLVEVEIGPIGKYKYDSKSTEKDSGSILSEGLNPIFDSLNGAGFNYVVSPRGEVVKVDGFADLLKDALKDNPLGGQFAGGGTDKAAVAELSQKRIKFPEKALSPGDTWEDPYELELPKIGKIKGTRSYKLDGWETVGGKKLAKITFTETTSVEIDLEQNGAKVSGTLSSESASGEALFDAAKGRIAAFRNKVVISGSPTVTVDGMDLTVEQKQTQEVKVELLDKLPE